MLCPWSAQSASTRSCDRYRTTDVESSRQWTSTCFWFVPFCRNVTCRPRARQGRSKRGLPTHQPDYLTSPGGVAQTARATFSTFPSAVPQASRGSTISSGEIVRAPGDRVGRSRAVEPSPASVPVSEDGNRDWENLVADLYRVDNEIAVQLRQHRPEPERLVGNEQEFSVRCGC